MPMTLHRLVQIQLVETEGQQLSRVMMVLKQLLTLQPRPTEQRFHALARIVRNRYCDVQSTEGWKLESQGQYPMEIHTVCCLWAMKSRGLEAHGVWFIRKDDDVARCLPDLRLAKLTPQWRRSYAPATRMLNQYSQEWCSKNGGCVIYTHSSEVDAVGYGVDRGTGYRMMTPRTIYQSPALPPLHPPPIIQK
jgi:hypothetical protein